MENMRRRPEAVKGVTYKTRTPMGTAYITINKDATGETIEVFTNVGKAGSDTAAVSEALGRLISLCLRMPSSAPSKDRLEEIVEQLSGIGGSRQLGFGKSRVLSLPDAIAKVLSEDAGIELAPVSGPSDTTNISSIGNVCPECGNAALVFQEGCQKCYSCGFSEC